MPEGLQRPRSKKRGMLMVGTTLGFVAWFCGWVYHAKVHRDLSRQLIIAVEHRDATTAKSLLARGADPNIRDLEEHQLTLWQQIILAFHSSKEGTHKLDDDSEVVFHRNMLEMAVNLNVLSDTGPHIENVPLVKALLDAGARVDGTTSNRHITPLMTAVFYNDLATVKLLLAHGANPLAKDGDGGLPIHYSKCNLEIEKLLVANGNDVNALENDGKTPLMWALYGGGNMVIIRFLISHGAHVNARSKDGYSALLWATQLDKSRATQLFIAHGAAINVHGIYGTTPLINAARGSVENVELLLRHGANIEAVDDDGDTALISSPHRLNGTCPEIVKILMQHGADVNHHNKAGETPLSIAQKLRYTTIVKLLKAAGAKR